MSSDESNATQISTVSNQDERKRKFKSKKPEQWEINLIGNFVLDLYHRSLISFNCDWMVKKCDLRTEYTNFLNPELSKKLKELNGNADIGSLLNRCGFILNTPRGSAFYKIKHSTLFEFRNNKLKQLDNLKINSDGIKQGNEQRDSILSNLVDNTSTTFVEENLEIDENDVKIPLEYQGSIMEVRKENFVPTNMSCCICQDDFPTMETYEEHIQKHGDDTDFEYLNTMTKFTNPIFKMSYRLCKNSHYFCFEFETISENLIIEKIIIVQSRSLYYVHNMRVPYKFPENGKERFFVDSHLFTIHLEQPIVLICHMESSKATRFIEQHHFMRSEEFPKVNFSINPNRLPDKKTFKPIVKLSDYCPPKEIQDALKDDFYYEKLMHTSSEFRDYVRNGKKLQPHNLGASINILLQIEDIDTIRQYINLTQNGIKLRSYGNEYSFQLKPKQRIFVENILSAYDEVILTSRTDISTKNEDIMELMLQNSSDIKRMKTTFVGQIQAVNTGRISFKCDQTINIRDSFTVICRPSRLTFRYQYRSLEILPIAIDFLKKFLFPANIVPRPLSTISLSLYNTNINGEQLQAVRNIAEGPRNDATYIIFGPPGTGKTTTIVEAILQTLKKPDTKILVTASSNSACDEVALRLCKYLKKLDIARAMVRIYSRTSELRIETIDEELLENSNMYNGQFYPDVEVLHEYRIVVCTLAVVAKLATGKFGRPEPGATLYTHLFIDEVAASMEAEALQGITAILRPKSFLIISGDHKQLGPVLQSARSKELGLAASLMDRLLERDCYRVDVDTGHYDRTIQTRLVRNYRSHPAIVNLYSGLYYNHTLEAYAKKDDVSLCEIWHKSRNKQYPIIFHAIYEPSRSDRQSHSLYNISELNVVMDYVKDLMYFGINGKPVKESDIGIISPYKKQYKRIQEELNIRKWFSIETGSVETFQGKEKDIIIVSFVRSGTRSLGFLDSPRRLNVTISRAKSLLIIVGNPQTLSLNTDFNNIIKECQRNSTFVGSSSSITRGGEAKKQPTGNEAKSEDRLTFLNQNMKSLNIDNKVEEKNFEMPKKSNNRDRRRRNSRNRNEKSNQESKGNGAKQNLDNDDVESVDSGSEQPSTSKRANLRNAKNMRQLNNKFGAKSGKISKQYGRGKQKNVEDNSNTNVKKSEIDTIFNELPKVPTTLPRKEKFLTNEKQILLQQQIHNYQQRQQQLHQEQQQQQQLLQQQQQHYYQNQYSDVNNSFLQMPANPLARPPFMVQQQHQFNLPAFNQPLCNNVNNGVLPLPNFNVSGNNAFANTNNKADKNKTQHENKSKTYNNTKSTQKTINFKNSNRNKSNLANSANAAKKSSKVAANIHANDTKKVNNINDKADNNKTNTGSDSVTVNSASVAKPFAINSSGNGNGATAKTKQRSAAEVNKAINKSSNDLPSTSSGNTANSASEAINFKFKDIPSMSSDNTTTTVTYSIGNVKKPSSTAGKTTTITDNIYPTIRNPSNTPNNIYPEIVKTTTTTSISTGNRASSSVNSFASSYSGNVPTFSSRPNTTHDFAPSASYFDDNVPSGSHQFRDPYPNRRQNHNFDNSSKKKDNCVIS